MNMASGNSGFSSSHLKAPVKTYIHQLQGEALIDATEAHTHNLKSLVFPGPGPWQVSEKRDLISGVVRGKSCQTDLKQKFP